MPVSTGKFSMLSAQPQAHAGRNNVPRCAICDAASTVSTPSPMHRPFVTSASTQSLMTWPDIGPNAFGFAPLSGRRHMPPGALVIASVNRPTTQGRIGPSNGQAG